MKQQGAMEPCQLEVEDMAMDVFERMRLRESTLRHEHDKIHEDKQRHVKLMTRDYTEVWQDHKPTMIIRAAASTQRSRTSVRRPAVVDDCARCGAAGDGRDREGG